MSDGRSQHVNLGCSTLILIALIVLIFSGGRNDEIGRKIQDLDGTVRQLKTAVDAQASEIRSLRQALESGRIIPPKAEAEEKK